MVGYESDVGNIDGYAKLVLFDRCNRNGIVEIGGGIIVYGENVFFCAVNDVGVTIEYGVDNCLFVYSLDLCFERG